eukprot:jgi/Bigna1/136524/aug1.34_g11232
MMKTYSWIGFSVPLVLGLLQSLSAEASQNKLYRNSTAHFLGAEDLLQSRGITEDKITHLLFEAALAQSIYRGDTGSSVAHSLSMPSRYREIPLNAEVHHGNNKKGKFLMLASLKTKTLYIVFKGTDFTNLQDVLADALAYKMGRFRGKKKIAALGFVDMYEALDYAMFRKEGRSIGKHVEELLKKYVDNIVIIGHSLGGALANLLYYDLIAGPDFQFDPRTVRLVTYGSPRTFSEEVADELQEICQQSCMRVVNHGDFVTTLPRAKSGFKHFGETYYISKKQGWNITNEKQSFSAPVMGDPRNHKIGQYITRLLKAGESEFGASFGDAFRREYTDQLESEI